MKKTILLLASLFGLTATYAQRKSDTTFSNRLSREWKLQYYGDNGKKQPPSKQQLEDRMFFYKDYRVLSIAEGKKEYGVWQYDPTKKLLTITDNNTGKTTAFEVLLLNNEQFIAGYKDPNGTVLEIHMLAVSK